MTAEEIWSIIAQKIEKELPQQNFDLWVRPIKAISLDENKLTLQVPNKFFSEWLTRNYKTVIEEKLTEILGRKTNLEYQYVQDLNLILEKTTSVPRQSVIEEDIDTLTSTDFNPSFTFDRFIEGASNRFAKSICLQVAKEPGKAYNPVFIYGGVGLGKTHLLHAVGNYIRTNNPSVRVLYITSERFLTEFVNSIKDNTTGRFRSKFCSLDCLLIDDIQFFTEKQRSQEEFFYVFNTLYDARKQIIITSDRSTKELSPIPERLISRFEWGPIVDIKPPDLETRIAILRKKTETEKVYVPDDVIVYLASIIKSNIRELEGSLITVTAFAALTGTPLTIDIVKSVLADKLLKEKTTQPITIERIQKVIAKRYNIEVKDLRSKQRTDRVAFPRQLAMYLARTLTDFSTTEIGEAFGGKDHTTIIYACNKISARMNTDPWFVAEVNKIIQEIKGNKS